MNMCMAADDGKGCSCYRDACFFCSLSASCTLHIRLRPLQCSTFGPRYSACTDTPPTPGRGQARMRNYMVFNTTLVCCPCPHAVL